MPAKLTFKEAQKRVNSKGIICKDGVWRPYQLLEFESSHKKAKFLCPENGEFTLVARNFWEKESGHPSATTIIREKKKKQTNLKKYGVEYVCQIPEIKQRVKNSLKRTIQKKYGADHYSQTAEYKEKFKKTCLEKYGVENPFQLIEVKEKIKKTNLEKYGAENPMQNKEIKSRVISKNIARSNIRKELKKRKNIKDYGTETPTGTQRMEKTCLDKYGVKNPMQNKDIKIKAAKTVDYKKANGLWNPAYGKTEDEIRTWLKEITNKEWNSNRTILGGKELDMYNEEYKLAIEYCGLYWHTEHSPQPRLKGYHNSKRIECEKQGIRLITIFEDEWMSRSAQVKNFLKSVLGSHTVNVFARKTEFKVIDKKEAKALLQENHIQGYNRLTKYCFGLYSGESLIAVMTFGGHHRQGNEVIVLDRFVIKSGYSIVGGASKLLKNALRYLPKGEITSWSDNRWSQGNVYAKLGFTLGGELNPDYSYYDSRIAKSARVSKQSQMKKRTGCPKEKTEKEWSLENGLWRIWDCGKKRWRLDNR